MKRHQDILRQLGESYGEWVLGLEVEFQMLYVRWAIVLLVLLVLGCLVRFRLAFMVRNTLPIQVVFTLLAIVAGFAIPLEFLEEIPSRGLKWVVSLGLISWVVLPLFLPMVLIRSRGYQRYLRKGLYFFEIFLIIVQWIALLGG